MRNSMQSLACAIALLVAGCTSTPTGGFGSVCGGLTKMAGNLSGSLPSFGSDTRAASAPRPTAPSLSESEIDARLAKASGVDKALVIASHGLDPSIDANRGDTCLYMLEKALARLEAGDADSARKLLVRAREDALSKRYADSFAESVGIDGDPFAFAKQLVLGDAGQPFRGADYEHLLATALISVCDFATVNSDAYAWAARFGDMQSSFLEKGYGLEAEHDPRKRYQRLALGGYLAGVIQEDQLKWDHAKETFGLAHSLEPQIRVIEAAYKRRCETNAEPVRSGSVHVVYFGGRGPELIETRANAQVESVMTFAKLISIIANQKEALAAAATGPVPVAEVRVVTKAVPPLSIGLANGVELGITELALDVNGVAKQQIEVGRPMQIARAVVRRALKAWAGTQLGEKWFKAPQELVGGAVVAGGLAAFESADTRCWTMLPAEIHAARFALDEGEHALEVGGTQVTVRVRAGHATMLLVVQRDLAKPPTVIVDSRSRVAPVAAK